MAEIAGVLPVDKPAGPTSHDVVGAARRALGTRRIGHTGTLDPFASGLLLLCIGPATRLAEFITPLTKTYEAVMRLGEATDTDDLQGEVIARSDAWRQLTSEAIRATLESQRGTVAQLPPRFSAKKVAGERMYRAARRGEEPERTPVPVQIHRVELGTVALPDVAFLVECGPGTYIRAIARDVGASLGVGAHLRALRRTGSGPFDVRAAVPLDQLADPQRVQAALVPPADAVSHLPARIAAAEEASALRHGRSLPMGPTPLRGTVRVLGLGGELLAIAEARGEKLQPTKVFA